MTSKGLRILVPLKRVIDYAIKIRISQNQIETNVKHSINPFCEIALEEALKLKDTSIAAEVVAVSCGPKACIETLRTALAMGCDRAMHVETNMDFSQTLQTLNVAKALTQLCQNEKPDLVILGKQAIDTDCNHTGQMLAARLGWPSATYASAVKLESHYVSVTREIDGGLQDVKMKLPAVITSDLRLNTPRYATLPNIMKAKKKTIETIQMEKLITGSQLNQNVKTIKVEEPPSKNAGIKVQSVDELLDKLKNEAKVI